MDPLAVQLYVYCYHPELRAVFFAKSSLIPSSIRPQDKFIPISRIGFLGGFFNQFADRVFSECL